MANKIVWNPMQISGDMEVAWDTEASRLDDSRFTDLAEIDDASGNEMLEFDTVASAITYFRISNNATTLNPVLSAQGEADTGMEFHNDQGEEILILEPTATAANEITIKSQATGVNPEICATGESDTGITFMNDQSEEILILDSVATSVNEITIRSAATGNKPIFAATGEADNGMEFHNDQAEEILILASAATSVNEFTMTSAATTVAPVLSATGDDANVNMRFEPKGTGVTELYSDEAGATGAILSLYQESASPVANDVVGRVRFDGEDDGSGKDAYCQIDGQIGDPTAGAEFGRVNVAVLNGTGSLVQAARFAHDGSNGLVVAGDNAAGGAFQSLGNFDTLIRTGNTTTGVLTMTDGAAGELTWAPSGVAGYTVQVTDDGAVGARMTFEHVSASQVANDVVGRLLFTGRDDAGTPAAEDYARIDAICNDPTAANPDGGLLFYVDRAGVMTRVLGMAGTGVNGVSVGDGAATGVVTSNGNFDLQLQTGNATTGTVSITDGANGAITAAPNGSGTFAMTGSGGVTSGTLASGLFALVPAVAQDNIAAAAGGAISVANYYTTINTDGGGDAFTLADGSVVGQVKRIQLIADGGGDGVVTPANLAGGSTITFADAGDYCILQWNTGGWVALVLSNEADGVTAPVLA